MLTASSRSRTRPIDGSLPRYTAIEPISVHSRESGNQAAQASLAQPNRCRPRERGDPVDTELPVLISASQNIFAPGILGPRLRGDERNHARRSKLVSSRLAAN